MGQWRASQGEPGIGAVGRFSVVTGVGVRKGSVFGLFSFLELFQLFRFAVARIDSQCDRSYHSLRFREKESK